MRKALAALLLAFALPFALGAQETIRVQAPNVVAADEQFNVTFIIEGEHSVSSFTWDAGADFQLVWGPQKGSSRSVSIVNGKKTTSVQATYNYVLLPKKTGKFSIASAHAEVNGREISSSPVTVEVVSNGSSSSSSSQSGGSSSASSSQSSAAATGDIARDDLFLRFSLSRTNVVVGEPVQATLKLYQRVNIAGFEDAKFPIFNGFWSQETFAPTNIEFKRESLGDKIYNTAILRTWTLIPQQAGDITIDPAELVCLVNVRAAQSSSHSIFDSFFQDEYRTIRKRVTSEAYKVHVTKLPAGAPASFGGGVGTFSIDAVMSKDSLKTHDAASLVITLSGKGNVSLLEAPKVNFPPDFEVYDTKVTDKTDKSNGRISGSKSFEYPFIPRSHGSFVIPPVQYSYYDVNAGRYVTVSTDSLRVSVARGNESAETPSLQGGVLPGATQKGVRNLGEDIRFIATARPSMSRQGSFFVGGGLFWALLVLILGAGAAFWLIFRGVAARRADVVGSKNRQATKMARKRLSRAGEFLKGNLYTAFYEELHKTLLGFIADKFNLDSTDMSKDNITSTLIASGVSEQQASAFTGLLDACEFARYAPDAGHDAMQAHYDAAVDVISTIDSNMKKKTSFKGAATTAVCALMLLLPGALNAAPAQADSLWNAGVSAYADGMWDAARASWEAILADGLESAELYYNIGNACFKQQDYAHAIMGYERALRLDPSYKDARANLEFAQSFTQDKIDSVPEFILKTWSRKLCWKCSSDTWAALFLVLLLATVALVLLFLLASGKGARRTGFFGAIAALVLAVMCLSFSLWQKADYESADTAVITAPVSSVRSAPGADSGTDLFVLHEGTKVQILSEVGSWLNIELADGRQGWVRSSELEII